MTEKEFATLVAGLKAVYAEPKYIEGKLAMETWYSLLKDLDYEVASMAVQAYMQTETYPPKPADIRKYASQITSPLTNDMSEVEAWGKVSKAICNSLYHSEEEFAKLPKLIQQTLGNHIRLRELAELESNELQTVEASNFMRSYRAKLEASKRESQLNESLRMGINQMRQENTPQIDVKVDAGHLIDDKSEKSAGIPDDVAEMLRDFHQGVYKAI